MKNINSNLKTKLTNSPVLRPFTYTVIYLRGLFLFLCFSLGLTKKSREVKKAIRSFNKPEMSKALKNMAAQGDYSISEFVNSYSKDTIKTVKRADVKLDRNEPILLCAGRNDLYKIKEQLKHHRKIGIRHFVYIDNMSTDGTIEWLSAQEDVSLFIAGETFLAERKIAWRKQAINIIDNEHWYLILDTDEFFVYPGHEKIKIAEYIDFLEKSGIDAALAPMIDMYSNSKVFKSNDNDFINECCYFDTNTYKKFNGFFSYFVYGGPRTRVFSFSMQLAKYPLVKMTPGGIPCNHSVFPYTLNKKTKRAVAFLLHYKCFSESEVDKFIEYARTGIYADGSADLKKYLAVYESAPDVSYHNNYSQKYTNSMDLLNVNIIDKGFIDNFLNKT